MANWSLRSHVNHENYRLCSNKMVYLRSTSSPRITNELAHDTKTLTVPTNKESFRHVSCVYVLSRLF
jgi:hypothetical protein